MVCMCLMSASCQRFDTFVNFQPKCTPASSFNHTSQCLTAEPAVSPTLVCGQDSLQVAGVNHLRSPSLVSACS